MMAQVPPSNPLHRWPQLAMRWLIMLGVGAMAAGSAAAQPDTLSQKHIFSAGTTDLPPEPLIEQALAQARAVRMAGMARQVAIAQRHQLAINPHEPMIRSGFQVRRDEGRRYGEFDLTLERAYRWPSRKKADLLLGQQLVEVSERALGESRHEAAVNLLEGWLKLQAQVRILELWQEQGRLAEEQQRSIERRVQLGDAARADAVLAGAMAAQVGQAVLTAERRMAAYRLELAALFPVLASMPVPASVPPDLQGLEDDDAWVQAILASHHGLRLLRAELELADLRLARLRSARHGDPVAGVRYASERSGSERILGLSIGLALGGPSRDAAITVAATERDGALLNYHATEAQLTTEIRLLLQQARALHKEWRKARDAARQLQHHADMMLKSYQLGEGQLQDVWQARRLAMEAGMGAMGLQHEARAAQLRILLDAHRLWDLDEHHPSGAREPESIHEFPDPLQGKTR